MCTLVGNSPVPETGPYTLPYKPGCKICPRPEQGFQGRLRNGVHDMNMKSIAAIAMLGMALPAAAELREVISQAYEVELRHFVAPATINGTTSFKKCERCEQHRVRVTAKTAYHVDDERVRLADFRKAIAQAGTRDDVYITVLHHLESDTVESIYASID